MRWKLIAAFLAGTVIGIVLGLIAFVCIIWLPAQRALGDHAAGFLLTQRDQSISYKKLCDTILEKTSSDSDVKELRRIAAKCKQETEHTIALVEKTLQLLRKRSSVKIETIRERTDNP